MLNLNYTDVRNLALFLPPALRRYIIFLSMFKDARIKSYLKALLEILKLTLSAQSKGKTCRGQKVNGMVILLCKYILEV